MRLGPFELFQPLASGGMSEVWSAWHVATGVFAAVKLIPPERVDPHSRKALQREIRTAAALDHPGIVWVYDQGTVDREVARQSDGKLVEGSPYLVMEYASYTLRNLLPITEWGELRSVLVGLLDALAHAHARGVIHRDLKPGNVLICGPEDLRPGLKLTDFGIAHALDATDPVTGARKVMGTPRYMAPEQVDGDWRSMGPGTDLYSLGCLTFRCLTGHGPFRSSGAKLLLDHLRAPPPPLRVPEGFPPDLASWVAWMLEKDPARRPSSAAAALEALPAGPHLPLSAGPDDEEAPTVPLIPVPTVTLRDRQRAARRSDAPLPGLQLLPVPSAWRRAPASHGKQLRDAGRALIGLRQLPMAGRIEERDRLWTGLRQSANRGEPLGIGVFGHAGLGRSRLLGWFTERASELGCASILPIRCRPRVEVATALRRVLDRIFLTGELSREARDKRLRDVQARLGVPHSPMLGLALDRAADLDVVTAGMRQFVERLSTKGPVLVTIDDIHHHPDLLGFVRDLLAIDGPVVVVLSAQEEAFAHDPMLHLRLADLVGFELHLQPLEGEDWSALVHSVLPLSPTLAARVAERTRGNPRFAVELLTDWVQRDILEPTKDGFEAPGHLDLPASVRAIWSSRLRNLLAELPDAAEPCVELAAVLGMEVDFADLRMLVGADETVWQALVTRLSLGRLTETTAAGFAFTHPALREVILRRAEQAGRLAEHHRVVAEHLAGRTEPDAVRRRGRHRAAAGDREGAFDDLFLAAQQARTGAGIEPALVLADEALQLVDDDDPRRAEVTCFRSRTLSTARNYEAARSAAREAFDLATTHGWPTEIARARVQLGVCAYHAGQLPAAGRHFRFAIAHLPASAATALGIANSHLGWVLMQEDDPSAAMEHFDAAAAHYQRAGGRDGRISQLMVLADRANFLADYDAVDAALKEAWALAFDPPQLMLQLHLLERRAYLAARQGDFVRARGFCEEMLAVAHALTAGATSRLRVLYGHVCLELDDPRTALTSFQICASIEGLPQSPLEQCMVFAGLAAATSALHQHEATESAISQLEAATRGRIPYHPTLDDLLARALTTVSTDDHHRRLQQVREGIALRR